MAESTQDRRTDGSVGGRGDAVHAADRGVRARGGERVAAPDCGRDEAGAAAWERREGRASGDRCGDRQGAGVRQGAEVGEREGDARGTPAGVRRSDGEPDPAAAEERGDGDGARGNAHPQPRRAGRRRRHLLRGSTSGAAEDRRGRGDCESEACAEAAGQILLLAVAVAVVTGIAGKALIRGKTAATPSPSSSPIGSATAPSMPAAFASASAVQGSSVYPCRDTKRPLPPHGLDRTCSDDAVAWCSQSMSVVACCAEGLVPDGDEGACGCPASADPASAPAACNPTARLAAGRLDPKEIQKVVRAKFGSMRLCYEDALKRAPNAAGRLRSPLRSTAQAASSSRGWRKGRSRTRRPRSAFSSSSGGSVSRRPSVAS